MFIQKIVKPKDAIRINSQADIPEFLQNVIKINGDHIDALSAEGWNKEPIPLGTVIGFDKKAPTKFGVGAWPLGASSYVEKDGVFYPAPEIRTAEKIEPPFSIETKYGIETLQDGQDGYLVTRPNGSKNILTLDTSSAQDYMVCTEDGKDICPLPAFAASMKRCEEGIDAQFAKDVAAIETLVATEPERIDEIAKELASQGHSGFSYFALKSEIVTLFGKEGTDVLDKTEAFLSSLSEREKNEL